MSDSILQRQFSVPLNDEESWPGRPFSLPIPNATLRGASSVSELGPFLVIGDAWADLVSHFLPENPVVLDFGCGW
jgi:hypothetical protein